MPTINNTISNTLLSGTSGSDSITNSSGYVSITSGAGNDTISNTGDDTTLDGGAGHDYITTYNADDVSIDGDAGDDIIELRGSANRLSVKGGSGNDTIFGSSTGGGIIYQYNEGDGYDVITGYKSRDTLSISGSSYSTAVSGNNIIVTVGDGKITLFGASGKTLNITGTRSGGGGTSSSSGKYLDNYGKNSLVSGTSYADTINNYAGGATVRAGDGGDYIFNSTSSNYTINSGYGYVTLDGGAGNDTIENNDPSVSINGGAGRDRISLNSGFTGVTINAGTGNDTIYGDSLDSGVLYQYKAGDGSDIIYSFTSSDTLRISDGTYSTSKSGSDVIVNVGNEKITLNGAYGKTINIAGTKSSGGGNSSSSGKYLTNYGKNSLVSGTSYADTINNYAGGATLRGGDGGDYIYSSTDDRYKINSGFGYVTIDGGNGNDTIHNYDPRVSINGGAGKDRISLYSSGYTGVTVNAGTGDDTIYGDSLGGGVLYQYKKGDGNDIIYSYNAKDSITISGSSSWSTVNSNNNVLLKVANSGTLTLVGAKGKTLNIYPAKTKTKTNTNTTPTPTPTNSVSPQEIIKRFMKSLDTASNTDVSALNEAVKYATGGYFQNILAAIGQMVADCQSYNNANPSNGWSNFLKEKCGIDLSNTDTGAITGSDAGTSSVKSASAIVPESGSVDDNFTDSSFPINGLTIQLANVINGDKGKLFSDMSYSSLQNSTQRYIWQALKTWWAKGALNLIAQSYGDNFSFTSSSTATVKKIKFGFVNENGGVNASTYFNPDGILTGITVNMNKYNSLEIGDSDGKRSSATATFHLDRVLAHEFTHAVMSANINDFHGLPKYIREGMAELTHGVDDDRKSEITKLAKNPSDLNSALDPDSGYDSYAGGYMFLHYLAKQGSEHYPVITSSNIGALQSKSVGSGTSSGSNGVSVKNTLLTVTKNFANDMLDLASYSSKVKNVNATILSKGTMIIGNRNANSISAGSGNDTVFGNTGNDIISGNKGSDRLYGEAGNDKLYGNIGNNTLNGGTGDDTLTGGDGKNVFIFGEASGKDVIVDYKVGKDKIKLLENDIINSSVKGSDVIFYLEQGASITVKGVKGKKITVIDKSGIEKTNVYTTTALSVTNSTKSPVTVGSAIKTINASTRTKDVKITGNALDNTITGGTGKNVIYGGAGNDYILGNTRACW